MRLLKPSISKRFLFFNKILHYFVAGYEWVGWRNDTIGVTGHVEILFQFSEVRNFTSMHIHTNNLFSKDVQVRLIQIYARHDTSSGHEMWTAFRLYFFLILCCASNFSSYFDIYNRFDFNTRLFQVFSHVKVFFSVGGVHFSGEPVDFAYMPDTVLPIARYVIVKLHNRIGKYLRLHLYFASRWIMISEVNFDSSELKKIFYTED